MAKRHLELTRLSAWIETVSIRIQSTMHCFANVIEAGLVALEISFAIHRGHDFFYSRFLLLSQFHFDAPLEFNKA
jgi:hypothetical protein